MKFLLVLLALLAALVVIPSTLASNLRSRTDDDLSNSTLVSSFHHRPDRNLVEENIPYDDLDSSDTRLRMCEGNCDSDSDCVGNLICFQRDEDGVVPGCIGGMLDSSSTDFCTVDPGSGVVVDKPLGNFGSSPGFKLDLCEGNCDTDDNCLYDLICFQRVENVDVPGCIGGKLDDSQTNYCVNMTAASISEKPSSQAPSEAPSIHGSSVPSSVTRPPLLSLTRSYGTEDSEASPNPSTASIPSSFPSKVSLFPTSSPIKLVESPTPTVVSTPIASSLSSEGSSSAPSVRVEEDSVAPSHLYGKPLVTYPEADPIDHFPLGRCEGDCDEDEDCGSGLYCYQRTSFDPVPGCDDRAGVPGKTDYCVVDDRVVSLTFSDPFRLRLYWNESYQERPWCVHCRNGSCKKGIKTHLTVCGSDDLFFVFGDVGDEKHQSIMMIDGTDLCLERRNLDIYLGTCNPFKASQLWIPRNGSFADPKFEVTQNGFERYCMTNRKEDEEVEIEPCHMARLGDTSFWIKD